MQESRPTRDGKVVLCRSKLKQLRQQKGLSQEKLAEQCAARGLRVSMPSIKRAETSRQILYRTASELARFFEVEFAALLPENHAALPPPAAAAVPALALAERRKLVFLGVRLGAAEAGVQAWRPAQLEAFQHCCELVLAQHGGLLYRRDGARVIAVFGACEARGDEIRRSLCCALDLRQRLLRHPGGGLPAAIGIVGGEGVLHERLPGLAQDRPLAAALDGVAVSIARLDGVQRVTAAGQVLVSDMIQQAAGSEFHFDRVDTALRRYSVQGLYALKRLDGGASADRPLVGRRRELALFAALLSVCQAERQGQVVYLRGMAGSGKTRLTQAWLERAERLGYRCHRLALGAGQEALQGVGQEAAGDVMLGRSSAWRWPLGSLAGPPAPAGAPFQAAMTQCLGPAAQAQDSSAKPLAALSECLRQQAALQPLLLCIEDIYRADRRAMALLLRLAKQIQDLPVILVLTSRLADDPLDAGWRGALSATALTILDLPPLRREEARELAGHFPWVTDGYRELCLLRAEGNPLFLEQLLQAERYRNGVLPHSLQILIQAQLHGLPPLDRQALKAAAVIGRCFDPACLRYLLDAPDYQCDELVRHYLVKRADNGFALSSQVLRQGVYDSLPQATRHRLHGACAQWFAGVNAEQAAFHLARS